VAAGFHQQPIETGSEAICPIRLDVTNRAAVETALNTVLARWSRLDVLVNNAGLAADSALWQLREEDWDAVLSVNLKGAFLCAQAALRPMLKQRDGHILNIASFAARSGPRGQANYAAAKAGLLGLTQSLAKEVGSRNVRVNAVLPGVLPTPMTAKLGEPVLKAYAEANALGRLNSLPEVAQFVRFLAGMQNVSGQVFQLDSRTARWT
jgi:3-oxoacyl-[acyl-carrier protein] reductase